MACACCNPVTERGEVHEFVNVEASMAQGDHCELSAGRLARLERGQYKGELISNVLVTRVGGDAGEIVTTNPSHPMNGVSG